jgi:hypothetical protein
LISTCSKSAKIQSRATYLLTEYQILGKLLWRERVSELVDFNLALVQLVDQLALVADQIVYQSKRAMIQ